MPAEVTRNLSHIETHTFAFTNNHFLICGYCKDSFQRERFVFFDETSVLTAAMLFKWPSEFVKKDDSSINTIRGQKVSTKICIKPT